LLVFLLTVKEPCWAREAEEQDRLSQLDGEEEQTGNRALNKGEKRSLILLLASVALWYMGFNAVTTKFSVYAAPELNMDFNSAMLVAQIAGLSSFLPAGMIASKIGRKKSILLGTAVLTSCFAAAYVYTLYANTFSPILYLIFILVGFSWAAISVNALPMVVEMCHLSDVGRFTGYYSTFSMAAQTITPIAAGALLENVSYKVLFLYSALFVAASFVTMLFVRHGDTVAPTKKSLLENFDTED
jgi:MFS family permease